MEPNSDPKILLGRQPDPNRPKRSGVALKNLRAASRLEKRGSVLIPEAEATQSTLGPSSEVFPST
jgi:hypothetical protein